MIYYNDDKYNSGIMKSAVNTDNGLTSIVPVSSKRSSFNQSNSMFFNEEISSKMYHQQLEIDQFIALHTENVIRQMEEMRKRNSKRLIEAALHEEITKRLKTKEEEITKLGELNYSLQEKMKSLIVENQIWMELAQTNEATANMLRNNLQLVLNQQQQQQHQPIIVSDDKTESCCGSNNNNNEQMNDKKKYATNNIMLCRKCGKKESCVLLLPCRHLCVCNVCDSGISICPVCKSKKSAGVHVNF